MATGACGIDCGVCGLHAVGLCSTCGPGASTEAQAKIDTQRRVLGAPCPILSCAVEKGVRYCLRDCSGFPCELFRRGPYPFSEDFLMMQGRRRREMPQVKTPVAEDIQVPVQYWQDLAEGDTAEICRNAIAEFLPPRGFLVCFLNRTYLVDGEERCLKTQAGAAGWRRVDYPLLELVLLAYLLKARDHRLEKEMITVQQMRDGHFFQGPHQLNTGSLVLRYGRDVQGFCRAAEAVGGTPMDAADAAYRIQALPRVPLYYLLWEGDEEFEPRLSILFDRSVEKHLSADLIWGLVQLVSNALLRPERGP